MNGVRDSKTVNGVEHTYYYASGKLLRETYGTNTLDFIYDSNGNPYALIYNGATYYYITNLQGDVMYMVDANGATVATYEYDPYGKVTKATGAMAEINPLRYRGYYYDAETGFYYLQSRYYDPAIGRFINADALADTNTGFLGYNMFAYCNNNPVNCSDPTGYALGWTNQVAICDGAYCKDEDESTGDNGSETWDRIEETVIVFWNNIEFSAGLGIGFSGAFDYLGLGFNAGFYGNYLAYKLDDGQWATGQEVNMGITTTFAVWDFGANAYLFEENNVITEESAWFLYDPNQSTIPIAGQSWHVLFIGGSYDLRFDLNNFLVEVWAVWGG